MISYHIQFSAILFQLKCTHLLLIFTLSKHLAKAIDGKRFILVCVALRFYSFFDAALCTEEGERIPSNVTVTRITKYVNVTNSSQLMVSRVTNFTVDIFQFLYRILFRYHDQEHTRIQKEKKLENRNTFPSFRVFSLKNNTLRFLYPIHPGCLCSKLRHAHICLGSWSVCVCTKIRFTASEMRFSLKTMWIEAFVCTTTQWKIK